MNKIKIFNKVTRCILVAMLALLPNAMWGDTTIDKVVTINDNETQLSIDCDEYLFKSQGTSKYKYACFYLEKDNAISSIENWNSYYNNNKSNSLTNSNDNFGFSSDKSYYYFNIDKKQSWASYAPWEGMFKFIFSPKDETTELSFFRLVLLLSDTNDFSSSKDNYDKKVIYTFISQNELDKLTFTPASSDEPKDGSNVYSLKGVVLNNQVSINLYRDYLNSILASMSKDNVSSVSQLYVRWYLADLSGNPINGAVFKNSSYLKKNDLYYLWNSSAAYSLLSDVLNVSISLPSGCDLSQVKLSCVISDAQPQLQYGVVTKEPESFDIKFNVSLEEAPLLNDLDASYSQNLKEKKLYVNATTINSKQLIFTDLPAQLEEFNLFQKNAEGNIYIPNGKSLYYRVSVIDKATKQLVSNIGFNEVTKDGGISGVINANSFQYNYKYKDSKGLYFSSKDLSSVPIENLYLALGFSGSDLMTKYRVEISISDAAPSLEEYQVVTEPTIKGKIVYDIVSASDAPFKHYKGYANADGDFEVIDANKGQLRQKVSK